MVESRSPGDSVRTFVGRQREMAELTATLDDALAGQGRLVMLAGEPGIGKTRTARELASNAESRGAIVLWGWCYEEEGAPPYWPWVQPIRSYVQQTSSELLSAQMGPGAAVIAEIVPEIRGKLPGLEVPPVLEPEAARFRLFDSITSFLKNASRSQPLMLVLDDLHWADQSSLLLLEFLARELGGAVCWWWGPTGMTTPGASTPGRRTSSGSKPHPPYVDPLSLLTSNGVWSRS